MKKDCEVCGNMEEYFRQLKAWAAKPYNQEGNLADWLLFAGIMTVATVLWTAVVKRIIS